MMKVKGDYHAHTIRSREDGASIGEMDNLRFILRNGAHDARYTIELYKEEPATPLPSPFCGVENNMIWMIKKSNYQMLMILIKRNLRILFIFEN